MKVWWCMICGDSYIGTRRPAQCPFCGAHEKFIHQAGERVSQHRSELTHISRKKFETALEMELAKSAFYECAAEKSGDGLEHSAFSALSRSHGKHASTIRNMLGLATPSTTRKGTCSDDLKTNLEEACRKQENAVSFYESGFDEISEDGVKNVCRALIEIEGDHLTLVQRLLENLEE